MTDDMTMHDDTSLEQTIKEAEAYTRTLYISECCVCHKILRYSLYYGSTLKYEGKEKPKTPVDVTEISHSICVPHAREEYKKIGLDYDKINKTGVEDGGK